jgi:TRAP-type C4-dicarboxylate transport system permease small subunit
MSGYLMAHDRHIALRVIDYVLPARVIGVIQVVGRLFVALTCTALAYAVYDLISRDPGLVTPAAQIPMTIVYAIALYGLASTALRAVVAVVVVDVPAVRSGRTRDA